MGMGMGGDGGDGMGAVGWDGDRGKRLRTSTAFQLLCIFLTSYSFASLVYLRTWSLPYPILSPNQSNAVFPDPIASDVMSFCDVNYPDPPTPLSRKTFALLETLRAPRKSMRLTCLEPAEKIPGIEKEAGLPTHARTHATRFRNENYGTRELGIYCK